MEKLLIRAQSQNHKFMKVHTQNFDMKLVDTQWHNARKMGWWWHILSVYSFS